MIIGKRIKTIVLGSAVGLIMVGCSSGDDTAACDEMLDVLTDGAEAITDAALDPAAAGEQIRGVAADLRSAAEGANDDITEAADSLATIYEDMADGFESGEIPEMGDLEATATALQEACS
jgi:hypothetical protein